METKLFELRDRATFIPAMAVKLTDKKPWSRENYLLRRAGLNGEGSYTILLWSLSLNKGYVDSFQWVADGHARTYPVCHEWLEKNFDDLEPGGLVDIEFILGEKPSPCESEQFTNRF